MISVFLKPNSLESAFHLIYTDKGQDGTHAGIGDSAGIKAAGGVRSLDTLLAMHEAGASRFGIGTGSAINIMKEVYERCGTPWDFEV